MAEDSLKNRIRRALVTENASDAFDLIREVEGLLAQTDPNNFQLAENLENLRGQLFMVALRYFGPKEIERVFENRISGILNMPDENDLIELFKRRLTSEDLLEDKNNLRKVVKGAIERSAQRLGGTDISLGSETVKPSVRNWIRLYTSEVGNNRAGSVEIARFFAKNRDAQKLSAADLSKLRRLIRFYEYLKIDSNSIEGYDHTYIVSDPKSGAVVIDDTGVTPVFTDQSLRELEARASRQEMLPSELSELQLLFPERFNRFKPRKLSGEELTPEEIQKQTAAYYQLLTQRYAESDQQTFKQNQYSLVVTSSLGLAGQSASIADLKSALTPILSDRQQLSVFLGKNDIKQMVLNEVGDKDKEVLKQQPFHPIALQAFLRATFEKGFGVSEEEAKWHASKLLALLPFTMKEFKTIVTYDVNQNSLAWRYQS